VDLPTFGSPTIPAFSMARRGLGEASRLAKVRIRRKWSGEEKAGQNADNAEGAD
jgi:hypothetical protein